MEALHYIHSDKWEFGRVHKKLGKLHYLIELDDKRIWKKHIEQVRKIGENTPLSISDPFSWSYQCENPITPNNSNNNNTNNTYTENNTGSNIQPENTLVNESNTGNVL